MAPAAGMGPPLSPSPSSMSSHESSLVGRYGGPPGPPGGSAHEHLPYGGGAGGAARPPPPSPSWSQPPTSPSLSQPPSASSDMSRPSARGSSTRPPSAASSVAMSSDGRSAFARPPNRDSARSQIPPTADAALSRHYVTLRTYLADSLQDEKGNLKPNRARDKLLRLSVTQFMELSTDVYDELIRREDERGGRMHDVPRFLLPKPTFHPKRNQARQKLSTLPADRFRQLATDVFYELERRIPRFAGGDVSRPMSTTSSASSRHRAPSMGGMGPVAGGMRSPPGPTGYPYPPPAGRGGPPRTGPHGPLSPYGPGPGPNGMPAGPPRRPDEAGSLGRPLPKHLQSNTMVPNKSTMVEDDDMDDDDDDDDDDEDEDAFGLDHVVGSGLGERHSTRASAEDQGKKMPAHAAERAELEDKVQDLEAKLREATAERAATGAQWASERDELERKRLDAQGQATALQQELAVLRSRVQDADTDRDQHEQSMRDMREQLDRLQEQLAEKHEETGRLQRQLGEASQQQTAELQRLHGEMDQLRRQLHDRRPAPTAVAEGEGEGSEVARLREQLARQEAIHVQVRDDAVQNLLEMRELSRRTDEAIEQEEKMAAKMAQLEQENDRWRQRYAQVKAQNKHLRASTMGLGLSTALDTGCSLVRQEGLISDAGLVRDTDVTRFQLAVDELLRVARQSSTDAMLESVKAVVVSVQSITSAVHADGPPAAAPVAAPAPADVHLAPSVGKIRARVTGTANSLITATKQHAASHGLSPVALLDAAASNLTASVVELIKAVKIRPSSPSELAALDDAGELHSFYDDRPSPTARTQTLRIPVPHAAPPASAPPPPSADAPTDAARSAPKAGGGWFGWAGKWGDGSHPDHPAPSQPHSPPLTKPRPTTTAGNSVHDSHHGSLTSHDSGSDYDPFR